MRDIMEKLTAGTAVDILIAGAWEGPFTVEVGAGRTPDHLILSGPSGRFEHYYDGIYNTRVVEDVVIEGETCDDCALVIVNDDDSGMDAARALEVREAIHALAGRVDVDSNEETYSHFSTADCNVCGTPLAGGRFSSTITY